MPRIHVGALLQRPPGPRYLANLHFAEIAPKPPLPKPKTLARWRATLSSSFRCALVVPREAYTSTRGALRFDEGLEERFAWLLEAADAVQAQAIVLPTGSELTTGQRDRDLLSRFVERIPRSEQRHIVWAPAGLWEPETALAQARRMGVIYAFDPLETSPPPGSVAYARLQALGARPRFSEGMLFEVLDRLVDAEAEEAYVAIESARSFREGVRLQQLAVSPEGEAVASTAQPGDDDEDELGDDEDELGDDDEDDLDEDLLVDEEADDPVSGSFGS